METSEGMDGFSYLKFLKDFERLRKSDFNKTLIGIWNSLEERKAPKDDKIMKKQWGFKTYDEEKKLTVDDLWKYSQEMKEV